MKSYERKLKIEIITILVMIELKDLSILVESTQKCLNTVQV